MSPISSWLNVWPTKNISLHIILYAASIFFVRALPHLELELIQSFLRTTSASNALRAVGLGEILIKCAHRQMAGLARDF